MIYRYSKNFKSRIALRIVIGVCGAILLGLILPVLLGKEFNVVGSGAAFAMAVVLSIYIFVKESKKIDYLVNNYSLEFINDGIQINDKKTEESTTINKSDILGVKSNKMPFPFFSMFIKLKSGSKIDLTCFERSPDLIEQIKKLTLKP